MPFSFRPLAAALALALLPSAVLSAPATKSAPVKSAGERNDYTNIKFANLLGEGLRAFYIRDFHAAQERFEAALAIIPDNTLAISFLNAAAVNVPGAVDSIVNVEEDEITKSPKSYISHVRLGFSYMFSSLAGRNRDQDAREELNAAVALKPKEAAAHVGLGIMRYNERSANRAKAEFLAALDSDKNNVLAREYLGELYQIDLRDPQRGLAYMIDVPNLVPDYADIDFHIGSLLYELKQSDPAIKYVTRGLEIDTGHVGEAGKYGYTLLARIYIDQHKLDDAKRVLNAAIASNSDANYARKLLDKIAKGDYDKKTDKPLGS